MNKLKNLYNIFASHPEGQWIMEPQNAQLIYQFIQKNPIKKVLDLGTGIGCSAAIIAQALTDKGETDWHIDTLDQFDKCINLAKALIPQELQKNITFHRIDAKLWETDKILYQKFSLYETIPAGEYDLIINDGPSPWAENDQWIDFPNATITKMLLEDRIKPGTFVAWDGRQHMLKYLERFFADNFYLARPAQRGDDLNILERKDNPVICKDMMFEEMKKSSYFNEKDSLSRHE